MISFFFSELPFLNTNEKIQIYSYKIENLYNKIEWSFRHFS